MAKKYEKAIANRSGEEEVARMGIRECLERLGELATLDDDRLPDQHAYGLLAEEMEIAQRLAAYIPLHDGDDWLQ